MPHRPGLHSEVQNRCALRSPRPSLRGVGEPPPAARALPFEPPASAANAVGCGRVWSPCTRAEYDGGGRQAERRGCYSFTPWRVTIGTYPTSSPFGGVTSTA